MMTSILDCTKLSFDDGFNGGCMVTHGVDRQLVCSEKLQALFLFLRISFFSRAVGCFQDLKRVSMCLSQT